MRNAPRCEGGARGAQRVSRASQVREGLTRLLFVAPEQLNNEGSRALIVSRGVALLVVDDAHCLSPRSHARRTKGRISQGGWRRLPRLGVASTLISRLALLPDTPSGASNNLT